MGDTQRSQTVSTRLQVIAEQARRHPEMIFTSLIHLMDIDFLREAYKQTRKDGAKGVDHVSGRDYGDDLEENLKSLHSRLRQQRYKAMPVRRTWIEKEDGSQRPLGIPAFEDKIVQRAVSMLMSAIYEHVEDCWRRWLGHRSRNGYISGKEYDQIRKKYPLPAPRIIHCI